MSTYPTDDPDTWDEDEFTRRIEMVCDKCPGLDPMIVMQAIVDDKVTVTADGETIVKSEAAVFILDTLDEIHSITDETP